jgi:hypothetical protein
MPDQEIEPDHHARQRFAVQASALLASSTDFT